MSNMKNTVKKSSSKESPTVFWIPLQSLETLDHLSAEGLRVYILDWLISSQGASLVNHSPWLEKDLEKATPEICGPPPSTAFASYAPALRFWKTSQGCLGQDILDEFSEIWPNSVLMCDTQCFQDIVLERLSMVQGYSFWPRPTASMGKRGWGHSRKGKLRYNANLVDRCFAKCGYKPSSETLEAIMGWPIAWSAAQPLEMGKFLSKWLTPFRSYLKELLNDGSHE